MANYLSDFLAAVLRIRRIADDHAAAGNVRARSDADQLVTVRHDAVHRLVEHVRSTVDGAKSVITDNQTKIYPIGKAHNNNCITKQYLSEKENTVSEIHSRGDQANLANPCGSSPRP